MRWCDCKKWLKVRREAGKLFALMFPDSDVMPGVARALKDVRREVEGLLGEEQQGWKQAAEGRMAALRLIAEELSIPTEPLPNVPLLGMAIRKLRKSLQDVMRERDVLQERLDEMRAELVRVKENRDSLALGMKGLLCELGMEEGGSAVDFLRGMKQERDEAMAELQRVQGLLSEVCDTLGVREGQSVGAHAAGLKADMRHVLEENVKNRAELATLRRRAAQADAAERLMQFTGSPDSWRLGMLSDLLRGRPDVQEEAAFRAGVTLPPLPGEVSA